MCCCGAMPLPRGAMIFTLIDALADMAIGIAILVLGQPHNPQGAAIASVPFFFMFLMDLLCILGIFSKVTCLVIFWQIFMIIHIVFMFIVWFTATTALVFAGMFLEFLCAAHEAAVEAAKDAGIEIDDNGNSTVTNTNNDDGTGLTDEQNEAIQDGCDALVPILGSLSFLLIIMPIVDIYLWIVVNSARRELSGVNPAQGAVMYPQGTEMQPHYQAPQIQKNVNMMAGPMR